MPGMKVTVDAAMRARDVSRPQPHDAAAAEAAIAGLPALRGTPGTRITPVPAPITRVPEPAHPAPPVPRRRPGQPVPGRPGQPVLLDSKKPAPPPEPAVRPEPSPAPQPPMTPNAGPTEGSHQGKPKSYQTQPPQAAQPGRDAGGASGPARAGRRKRVRRRRSHGR